MRQFTSGGRFDARADVIAFGHTHVPYHRTVDGVHFVNAGSVGRPKDGDARAGYCILTLDGQDVHAEQVRVPYDVELACRRLLDAGLPPYFAAYLRTGGAVPETAPERAILDRGRTAGMTRLVIIGGSDAGISAALRAREIDPSAEVRVLVADRFPNYSICGLPFYLSGEVPDWRRLAHRTAAEIEDQGIALLLEHTATRIDSDRHTVAATTKEGTAVELAYDRLIVGTGAEPLRPPIAGLDLPGVYLLHSMADSFAVHAHLSERAPRTALIVGGGYIGLEMADALIHRGLAVSLVELAPTVMTTVDPSLGAGLADELRRHGVAVHTGVAVGSIAQQDAGLLATGSGGFRAAADLVIVAAGVRPSGELARAAGIAIGERGAIRVGRGMDTNQSDIFAAGDCAETWHRLLGRPTYLPLGTTAHKQGRVAGENAVGGRALFAGSLGTQVVKVFELAAAGTGLGEVAAAREGLDALTTELTVPDHKAYYPGAHDLRIRVTGERGTGRLLGAQILGHWQAGVAKRIDVFATALFHGMRVDELGELDLSYTPPLSSPWDPVQLAAQSWVAAARGTAAGPGGGRASLPGPAGQGAIAVGAGGAR